MMQTLLKEEYSDIEVTDCVLSGATRQPDEIVVGKDNGILNVTLKSSEAFEADRLSVSIRYNFAEKDKIFVNGYQSWTDSFEYNISEKMFSPAPLMNALLKGAVGKATGISAAGDMPIVNFKREVGRFYGFSYGYVRRGNEIDLFGSLSERTGYTIITFDACENRITIEKDLQGKRFPAGDNTLLSLGIFSGEYNLAFDAYFKAMGLLPHPRKLLIGYTTWYNYYQNINEHIVERDLNAIEKIKEKVDIFQIDDGYEKAVGDWLNSDSKKFPRGMKVIAEKIRGRGMLAGIWLAPFAATKNSFIFKEHKDWLVRDNKGRLIKAGANWGGFYSLDLYNSQVREYLKKVFDTVLYDWGYDMVKLDFLYCVCIAPVHGKTRGEIMCDAMDFLRECCKDKLILGCGVPLAPAFGKVDYCRIGPDVSLDWGKRRYDSREGVSTVHAMLNSVFRRHLDGRAFGNDPDVFLLRDNNIRLSHEQKKMLAKCNKLCGKVLFTSDNVDDYDEDKKRTMEYVFDRSEPVISEADYDGGVLRVKYCENGSEQVFTARLKD